MKPQSCGETPVALLASILITLLRKEMAQQPALPQPFDFKTTDSAIVEAAAAW